MRKAVVLLAGLAVLAMASGVMAIPYASGIQDLGGGNYSFVLNEDADMVTVALPGGGTLPLGPQSKGTVNFASAIGYESISVQKSAPTGWTQISDDADNTSKYYLPRGVAVNRNPGSPNFGRIYANNAFEGTTVSGRPLGDGFYVMTADQADVTGQGDTAYTGGIDWTAAGSSSPFRMMVAPDDSLYIADWSDGHSGVWRAPADLSGTYDQMLANETNVNDGSGGLYDNHGSIPGVWVEGAGTDTKLYTLDEDLDMGGTPGSVLQYDIGTQTQYAGMPTEVTQDGTDIILNLRADLVRDEDGSWWVAQYRFTESPGAPSLTRFLDGASSPVYNSAADDNLPLLAATYGSIDIHDELDLLVMGARSSYGVYVIDISDPNAPELLATIPQSGYAQDVAFDAAGNIYVVNSTQETLQIFSPGGTWEAITGADGSFILIPEPASLALFALGGLALLRRRR